MHRCHINSSDWVSKEIILSNDESHHVVKVLRAKAGDSVSVFDGLGKEAEAIIEFRASSDESSGKKSGKQEVVLNICTEVREIKPLSPEITLIVALPKGKKMDLIIEKATEIGVSSVLPVISERVITRLDESQRIERSDRWQKLALSAARQSGAGWVPKVMPVSTYNEVLVGGSAFDVLLVGSLGEEAKPFHSVMNDIDSAGVGRIAIIIGPEGDLTPAEVQSAIDAGAVSVSFGSQVLRVETAVLYALSILSYELR